MCKHCPTVAKVFISEDSSLVHTCTTHAHSINIQTFTLSLWLASGDPVVVNSIGLLESGAILWIQEVDDTCCTGVGMRARFLLGFLCF